MKCVIPALNTKVFARSIHSLARIGEELHLEPNDKGLSLRTINLSRSAFACFTFTSRFFSNYDNGAGNGSTEEFPICKVGMKACLNVFRSINNVEKTVEKCKLTIDFEDNLFIIQLICKYKIEKTYNISFIECESLQAVTDTDSCCHKLTSQSKLLSESFLNFLTGQEEVTFDIAKTKTTIRNYTDDESGQSKTIQTELTIKPGEFDVYSVKEDSILTFSLKELRALLMFTEPNNLPVTILFSTPGQPVIFSVDNLPIFEINFVLATLVPDEVDSSPKSTRNGSTSRTKMADRNKSNGETSLDRLRDAKEISRDSERIVEEPSLIKDKSHTSHNGTTKNHSTMNPLLSTTKNKNTPLKPTTFNGNGTNAIPSPKPLTPLRPPSPIDNGDGETDDMLPGTPPKKKARFFFQRCFNSTFDPSSIPGYGNVLAEDSDEES